MAAAVGGFITGSGVSFALFLLHCEDVWHLWKRLIGIFYELHVDLASSYQVLFFNY